MGPRLRLSGTTHPPPIAGLLESILEAEGGAQELWDKAAGAP